MLWLLYTLWAATKEQRGVHIKSPRVNASHMTVFIREMQTGEGHATFATRTFPEVIRAMDSARNAE